MFQSDSEILYLCSLRPLTWFLAEGYFEPGHVSDFYFYPSLYRDLLPTHLYFMTVTSPSKEAGNDDMSHGQRTWSIKLNVEALVSTKDFWLLCAQDTKIKEGLSVFSSQKY